MDASLAQSAVQLPWLAPGAPALAALARGEPVTDPSIAADPAAVLLLLRHSDNISAALTSAYDRLREPPAGVLDRGHSEVRAVLGFCRRSATIARLIAESSGGIDLRRAWAVGLLAPLGWLAIAATDPAAIESLRTDSASAQTPAFIARRLARRWQLPAWLGSVVGHLDLPIDVAPVAAADVQAFALAQAAVGLAGDVPDSPRLSVGIPVRDALGVLGIDADTADAIESDAGELLAEQDPQVERVGGNPYAEPLLPDLLRVALSNDHRADASVLGSLEAEVDRLHRSLLEQRDGEEARLRVRKLTALAEFAAGAGHEINNPLAVISGQAQYLLADESEPPRQRSLQTIVQQAQRIHQILTDLMQFARPGRPQKRAADVRMLARAAATGLHEVAALKQVQIEVEEPDEACVAECDPRQLQTALSCLLRNAIEAALADGWARLRVEASADRLRVVVEDSGAGPAPAHIEHLFDPFYSGRAAGRGRGLGLPTAWRLAREQGGEVTFEAVPQGPTRFVLTLPRVPAALLPQTPDRLSA